MVLSFSLLLVTAQAGHAGIVTLTSFDVSNSSAATNVAGNFTVTPFAAGNPTTYSFTHTANMDGGTINDTLSFDFVYTMYTGSTFSGGNVTLGTSVALADFTNPHFMNNYVGDGSTNTLASGDSFTASITNISYTSGEGFTNPAVSFDGFNSIRKFGAGSPDDIYLGTTGAVTKTVAADTGTTISLDGVTELAVTTAITSGTTNQRWRDLNFSFTVPDAVGVPEPSSAVFFAMGIATVAFRRRRS